MSQRLTYQAQAVFVSNSPATGSMTSIVQLHRVTSVNNSFSVARQDVQQFGMLAAIDRVILAPPTVNLEIGYNVSNVLNESRLGFYIGNQSALKYILDGTQDSKNYFIRVVPEGNDAAGYTGVDGGVIGVGNGFITSYSTQGAVGGIPSATIRVEASNIKYDDHSDAIGSPAVEPLFGVPIAENVTIPDAVSGVSGQASVLQPGQIQIDIGAAGLGISGKCIQSYTIGLDLRREPLQCLGTKFPFARVVTFPITVSMDVEANQTDLGVGNLADVLCDDVSYDLGVAMYAPSCTGLGPLKARWRVLGAKLDSQNETASIGPNKRVTMRFSAQVGGPQDITHGLFIDGSLN